MVAGYAFSSDGDVTGNHGAPDFWIVKLSEVTIPSCSPVVLFSVFIAIFLFPVFARDK